MKNILIISFISLFFITSFTSCGIDSAKSRAANLDNQPESANANTVYFYGKAAGSGFDEMTLPVIHCGSNDTSYARMPNKDRATKYNNLVDDVDVWVKMKLIHPVWFNGKVTKFEIVSYGVITKSEPAPCDCEKDTVIVTEPKKPARKLQPQKKIQAEPEIVIVKDDAPPGGVIVKEKPAANNNTEVGKKTGTITPGLISPSDVEVVTTIKVKGKQVSETTTNLGDVVDASAPTPESGEVDAGE